MANCVPPLALTDQDPDIHYSVQFSHVAYLATKVNVQVSTELQFEKFMYTSLFIKTFDRTIYTEDNTHLELKNKKSGSAVNGNVTDISEF